MSMYKIGDLVRIKKREGETHDYPLSYVFGMRAYEGRIAKIVNILNRDIFETRWRKSRYYNGDNNIYYLEFTKGIESGWFWSSSMFTRVQADYTIIENNFIKIKNIY